MPESGNNYGDLIIESRKKATLTGITDVESFDEETIIAQSECGEITVRGSGMKISRLSVESGDMLIEGHIDSVSYGTEKTPGGFFGKLFK